MGTKGSRLKWLSSSSSNSGAENTEDSLQASRLVDGTSEGRREEEGFPATLSHAAWATFLPGCRPAQRRSKAPPNKVEMEGGGGSVCVYVRDNYPAVCCCCRLPLLTTVVTLELLTNNLQTRDSWKICNNGALSSWFLPWVIYIRSFISFLGGSDGKESACDGGNPGLIPGSGRSLGKGMATHSRIPAWRIPWTEEPGGLQSLGLHRVEHDWSNLAHIESRGWKGRTLDRMGKTSLFQAVPKKLCNPLEKRSHLLITELQGLISRSHCMCHL